MRIFFSAIFFALIAAAAQAADPAAPLGIGESTHTISSLYTGDRVRDPFLPPSMGAARPTRTAEEGGGPEVIDIHGFQLRGILKDPSSDFAIFAAEGGQTFLLRAGLLYDGRNKRVPGMTGRIRLKQKRVELITADKDVQVFVLGESDANKDKDKEKDQKP